MPNRGRSQTRKDLKNMASSSSKTSRPAILRGGSRGIPPLGLGLQDVSNINIPSIDDVSEMDSVEFLDEQAISHNSSSTQIHPLRKPSRILINSVKNDIRSPMLPHHSFTTEPHDYFTGAVGQSSRPELGRSKSTSSNIFFHVGQEVPASPIRERLADSDEFSKNSLTDSNSIGTSSSNYVFMQHERTLASSRNYYNDFTTIDWVKAFIDKRNLDYQLKHLRGIKGALSRVFNRLESWVLIIIISLCFAVIAYWIDKTENLLVDFKHGYCQSNWFSSELTCCTIAKTNNDIIKPIVSPVKNSLVKMSTTSIMTETCSDWKLWSNFFESYSNYQFDFLIYFILTLILAYLSVLLTLTTKTTTPLPSNINNEIEPKIMYTAYGSGVPEVKTILSGYVIRKFLGGYTLIAKTMALVLAIASGMSLGKEGPYVHLATCCGNVLSRLFPAINNNNLSKKQILTASASAGVALAFGSPLGGILFTLEEVNHYLPSNQLFKIFFCAICSTLFLKFLNPYGTGKTVMFEVQYTSDWKAPELIFFVLIGIFGGIFGAMFIRFTKWWSNSFRKTKLIKDHPIREVLLIAAITAMVTFGNPYTKQPIPELLFDLSSPCDHEADHKLCPTTESQIFAQFSSLSFALIVKIILTAVTFGLKVPAGIYVPTMVIGALFGRLFAIFLEFMRNKSTWMGLICDATSPGTCVDLGIYSMISAGAFMAGVTRMNITLVTILFELTSSYTYVLPISIAIAVSNWIGSLIEEFSLYETLLIKNDYPFLGTEIAPFNPLVSAGDIIQDDEKMNHFPRAEESVKETTGLLRPIVSEFKQTHSQPQLQYSTFSGAAHKGNDIIIDISDKPFVSSTELRFKLTNLQKKGHIDGCIALIKNKHCVGLISTPELEFGLDRIKEFCVEYSNLEEIYVKFTSENDKELNSSIKMKLKNDLNLDDVNDFVALDKYQSIVEVLDDITDLSSLIDSSPIYINKDSELSLVQLIFEKVGNRVLVLLKEGRFYGVLHKKAFVDYCRKTNRG